MAPRSRKHKEPTPRSLSPLKPGHRSKIRKRGRKMSRKNHMNGSAGQTTGHHHNLKSRKKNLKVLPVTVLSGFLGSGKTTLLKHILQSSEHGLRIAVIVNDIGPINVDGAHIRRTEENVVELQNGCICCTLRGDLIEELVRIHDHGAYDYVIIESSGISEPEQVAESFDPKIAETMIGILAADGSMENPDGLDDDTRKILKRVVDAGGIDKFARLDTAVSVVDAFTILTDFETDQIIADRRADADPDTTEGGQTVSHLLVDQIEFANVIIINKTDMVDTETLDRIKILIRKMNHNAQVIESSYGRVDVGQIVNTNRFDLEHARHGAGWLQDLHELAIREVHGRKVVTPKPETEEYGVGNFVYTRYRPFHPRRLWECIYDRFILRMESPDDMEEEDDEGMQVDDDDDDDDERNEEKQEENPARGQAEIAELTPPPNAVIVQNRRNDILLSRLFRSKGAIFLATRPERMADWSQAGAALELVAGTRWFCTMSAAEAMTGDADIDSMIRHDMARGCEWGDRRQEIVFIGERLDIASLEQWLDRALLDDDEWERWQLVMRDRSLDEGGKRRRLQEIFEDGFPDWPGDYQEEDLDGSPGNNGHHHRKDGGVQ